MYFFAGLSRRKLNILGGNFSLGADHDKETIYSNKTFFKVWWHAATLFSFLFTLVEHTYNSYIVLVLVPLLFFLIASAR